MRDLFERTVFRSESGGSDYEPQTYTMYLQWPHSGPNSYRAASYVGIRGVHELFHWIQCISYTFGGFQSALIHMCNAFARDSLTIYANIKDERQRKLVRFSLPDNPKGFFNLTFDHEWINKDIYGRQIAWRDALLCERLFLHLSSFYGKGDYASVMASADKILQPESLIPRMLLSINNWAIRILYYGSAEPLGNLEFTDPANPPELRNFVRAIHANIELDTINIIEGMAVVLEMYSLNMSKKGLYAKERLEEIERNSSSYLHAIKIFFDIMGLSIKPLRHDDVARVAMLFLALAEMSLNPPLPPFGIINKLELDWNKIYPPLRFIELCRIAKRVVWISLYILDPHPYRRIFEWIVEVESLYLSQGGVFSYLYRNIDGYLPNEKSLPFLALIAQENPIMQVLLCHKGVNITGMAEKFPEVLGHCTGLEFHAMLSHAHVLFMNLFGIPRPFLIPSYCERAKIKHEVMPEEISVPPLIVYQDGDYILGWPEKLTQYLIDFNLSYYPLHNIMLRKEPGLYLPNCPLIDEGRRKEHWEHLQKTFCNIF